MSQSMSFLYFYDIVVLVIEIIGGLNTCRPTEKEYLTVNHPPPHTYSLYHSLMMKMKLILLATLASLALGAIPLSRQSPEEDYFDEMDYSEEMDRAIGILTTGNFTLFGVDDAEVEKQKRRRKKNKKEKLTEDTEAPVVI